MLVSSPARREWSLVAAFSLIGAVLRFWGPGRLGLNHFDEGVYALAGLWSVTPKGLAGIGPELVAYAPPLFPILVGVSYLFLGVSDVSAILVSQVCGVLTIPAVAWVARRTFGPGAGAAAAALVAVSGLHVAFSRMALTDSTFLLCWVLALGFGGRFLERPGILRAIPFGLMVGLAQNAKYNGYLAGGIVAITAVWGLVLPSSEGRIGALRAIGYGLIAAMIAGLVYLPWYRFVESQPGGYAALVRHHRGYLSGPSAWPEHWRLQMGQAFALSGRAVSDLTWGLAAWPLAWGAAWFTMRGLGARGLISRWDGARFRLGLLAGSVAMAASTSIVFWASLARLPWLIADRRPAVRLVGVLWVAMAILTPFYHPYARLWLPIHAAGWLIVSRLALDFGPLAAAPGRGKGRAAMLALAAALSAGLFQDLAWLPRPHLIGSPIEATDDLRNQTARCVLLMKTLPTPVSRLRVLARPAMLFYLHATTPHPIARAADRDDVSRETRPGDVAVIDGFLTEFPIHLRWSIDPVQRRTINPGLVPEIKVHLPPATQLDVDPGAVFDPVTNSDRSLVLYPLDYSVWGRGSIPSPFPRRVPPAPPPPTEMMP